MAHPLSIDGATRAFRRALGTLLLLALLPALPAAAQADGGPEELRTPAEESNFTRYTSHDEMMEYLDELRARSDEFRMGIYGETREGRSLPYLVFSRPAVTRGWEAAALGKPVVELHANVHGGERTLRESLLILVRELATPGTPENALLDDMVIVVSPQINPDGFEATDRGIRGNAWGIDLNRDYMKLDHPSIRDWVRNVLHEWNPHVFVDGHNGGQFPYHLKYQCPGHADPDQSLTAICDDGIFPRIDERLEAEGFQSFFWASGNEDGWRGGQTDARISRNYAGFANAIGILFESPGWQDMSDGVPAGRLAYLAVMEYVRDHPDEVMGTVNEARRQAILLGREPTGEIVVEMDVEAEDETVDFLIGREIDGERQVVEVTDAPMVKRPVAVRTRARPYAYILPRDAEEAVQLLRNHNITVERLESAVTVEVEAYEIEGVSWGQAHNHRGAPELQIGEAHTIEQTFPRGSYVVPTGQMMGRIATHLLEPETRDNLIYWGYMARWLPLAQLHSNSDDPVFVPIFRLMDRQPLPGRMIP